MFVETRMLVDTLGSMRMISTLNDCFSTLGNHPRSLFRFLNDKLLITVPLSPQTPPGPASHSSLSRHSFGSVISSHQLEFNLGIHLKISNNGSKKHPIQIRWLESNIDGSLVTMDFDPCATINFRSATINFCCSELMVSRKYHKFGDKVLGPHDCHGSCPRTTPRYNRLHRGLDHYFFRKQLFCSVSDSIPKLMDSFISVHWIRTRLHFNRRTAKGLQLG